jgi:hypothetical protein
MDRSHELQDRRNRLVKEVNDMYRFKPGWPEILAHPGSVKYDLDYKTIETLDTIQSLIPFELKDDKYVELADWLREAESEGLITQSEHQDLRHKLAPLL